MWAFCNFSSHIKICFYLAGLLFLCIYINLFCKWNMFMFANTQKIQLWQQKLGSKWEKLSINSSWQNILIVYDLHHDSLDSHFCQINENKTQAYYERPTPNQNTTLILFQLKWHILLILMFWRLFRKRKWTQWSKFYSLKAFQIRLFLNPNFVVCNCGHQISALECYWFFFYWLHTRLK